MKKTRLTLLGVVLVSIMCLAVVGGVHAQFSQGVIYSKFNTTNWTWYQFGETYTSFDTWITNNLVFNGTNGWAKVAFINATGHTDSDALILFFSADSNKDLKVYVCSGVLGTSDTLLISGTWSFNTTEIVFDSGTITIYGASGGGAQ
jgi:hypothetical protein